MRSHDLVAGGVLVVMAILVSVFFFLLLGTASVIGLVALGIDRLFGTALVARSHVYFDRIFSVFCVIPPG